MNYCTYEAIVPFGTCRRWYSYLRSVYANYTHRRGDRAGWSGGPSWIRRKSGSGAWTMVSNYDWGQVMDWMMIDYYSFVRLSKGMLGMTDQENKYLLRKKKKKKKRIIQFWHFNKRRGRRVYYEFGSYYLLRTNTQVCIFYPQHLLRQNVPPPSPPPSPPVAKQQKEGQEHPQ